MKLKSCMHNDIKMMIFNKRYLMIFCTLIMVFTVDLILVNNNLAKFNIKDIDLFDVVFLGNINSFFGTSFHYLMPLLIVFPISNYIYQEKRSDYFTQVISRSGRMSYHLSKCFISFMVGFTLLFFTLVFNLILAILILKNDNLFPSEVLFSSGSAFESIFYSNIVLYYFIYIVLRSFTAGLIACLAYISNSIFRHKNEILVILTPLIFLTLQSVIITFVSPNFDILQIIQINTRYALSNPVTNIIVTQVFGFWMILSLIAGSFAYLRLRDVV